MDQSKEERIKTTEQKRTFAQRQAKKDLEDVLSTDAGKRVLARVISHGSVFTAFRADSERDYAYQEGKRFAALHLIGEINEINPSLMATISGLALNINKEIK